MKKFVMAAFCTLALAGLAMAEEFTLRITKINDDGRVSGDKSAVGKVGPAPKAEAVTVKIAKDVKVFKGKLDKFSWVKDGDDLGLTGLKTALKNADKISVGGTALTDKDTLEVAIRDGKPAAKLNGKDVDINTLTWKVTPLRTRVTTNDDGTVTQILLTGGWGGGKGNKKGGPDKGP